MGDEVARVGIVQVALRAAALEAGEDPAPVVRGERREVVRHHGVPVLAFLPARLRILRRAKCSTSMVRSRKASRSLLSMDERSTR